MGELQIKIRYESFESLLNLEQAFNSAVEQGVREINIVKSPSGQDKMVPLMVRQVVKYLQQSHFDSKLNRFTLIIGCIQSGLMENILSKLNQCRYLTCIDLGSNKLKDSSVRILSMCNFQFIKNLNLSNNSLTYESMLYLSNCPYRYLQSLDVSKNTIKNKGVMYLAKCRWQNLINVNIDENKITNDGIKALVKGQWGKVNYMNLKGNGVENEGFKYFVKNGWYNLAYILWSDNRHTFICTNQCSKLPNRSNPVDCLAIQALYQYQWSSPHHLASVQGKFRIH